MIDKVAKYMEQWHMVQQGEHVLVGVSGGADSVCLCCVLKELSEQMHFTLEAVHVEHGIRGEDSLKDAAFVEEFCRIRHIPCVTYTVNVLEYAKEHHVGTEEAARVLRYEAFAKEAAKHSESKIALAHHMEDNAETLLLQMIRGSGIDGMCGIHPIRRMDNGLTCIRPLLAVSRIEIEQELKQRNLTYCVDATNQSLLYSRNRIRHKVLPELTEVNAQTIVHLNQMAERMNELRLYVDEKLEEAEGKIVTREPESIRLSIEELSKLPNVLRTRLVQKVLEQTAGAKRDIEACHVEAVLDLATKQSGRRINLPCQMSAQRSYSAIVIQSKQQLQQRPLKECPVSAQMLEQMAADGQERILCFGEKGPRCRIRAFRFSGNLSEIPRKMYTKWFDYDKIKFGFSIRTRRNQDYIVIDAKGHHQKLADYLINQKIPVNKREQILLVAEEQEIQWVIGGRIGATALVDAGTKMILEIVYEGGTRDGLQ